MLARQSVPVSGALCSGAVSSAQADDQGYLAPGDWQIAVGYRWQKSDRAFIGTEEQVERRRLGIISINRINLFDVAVTYGLTPRLSISASIPFVVATRTRPGAVDRLAGFPNAPDQVFKSSGFGDLAIAGRFWLVRPPSEKRQNISVGFGVKLPTGKKDVSTVVNTPNGAQRRFNDQSIQLGDGGLGFTVDMFAFKSFRRATVWAAGTYLFNPRNTNGVPAGRVRPSEAVNTVADQYLGRLGVTLPVRRIPGVAASFGLRAEGVPSRDLIGKSDGFRRPGYALSFEPGFSYTRKKETWNFNVPVPFLRKRSRSVPEARDNVRDAAAFADYLITVGYARRI